MNRALMPFIVGCMVLAGCTATQSTPPPASTPAQTLVPEISAPAAPSSLITMNTTLQKALPTEQEEIALIKTTLGNIVIRFFPAEAPKTVENFIGLSKKGYYNGVIFHRVMPNFMAQGGDPTGTGRGGESLWGGQFENEPSNAVSNKRGSISMANAGGNATNGSQFFINVVDNTFLDAYANGKKKDCSIRGVSCHTVFGEVIEGMEVVDAIVNVKTDASDKPLEAISMESVTIMPYSQYKK